MASEKRKIVMARSLALGACVCDPRKPCPCPELREQDICECAGERPPPALQAEGPVRLTRFARGAGCASKIPKRDLEEILAGLPEINDPRVILGASAGDDAGVVKAPPGPGQALILTVDVFAPSVDDPYEFGQVAAANSVSDVYAMGGTPLACLSILCFPTSELPNEVAREILRGGVDKMAEAGVPVVGGHSVKDSEVKCGFAVVGSCRRGDFIRNAGARVGDAIVLTKPLGTGIVAFAHQLGLASDRDAADISLSMRTLNKTAAGLMRRHGVHAATDVTGFSLLGHAVEIVKNSGVAVDLDFDAIPLFPEVADLARGGVLPGAVERNREATDPALLDLSELADAQSSILFGPETSGGLLVFLPRGNADAYVKALRNKGIQHASVIGRVTAKRTGGLIKARTSMKKEFESVRRRNLRKHAAAVKTAGPATHSGSCCAGAKAGTTTVRASEPLESTSLPPLSNAFSTYISTVAAPGAIDLKTKKLMALALSVATRCEPCLRINTDAARKAGATNAEIAEAAALGAAFGGAPAAMMYNEAKGK